MTTVASPSWAAIDRAEHETVCTFQPKNGRYADRCRDTAVWAVPRSPNVHPTFQERRCQRHYDIDARTYAKRGWGSWQHDALVPFDAAARRAEVIEQVTRQEQANEDLFWAHCEEAVQERDLDRLRDLAKRGRF